MAVGAVHLVPDALHGQRVLADDQRAQVAEQHRQHFLLEQAVDAFGAAARANAHVVLRQRHALGLRAGGRVLEGLGAALLVDVQRLHLELAIEAAHQFVRARELQDFDLADEQGVISRIARRRRRA